MRLADLHPCWVEFAGRRIGVAFDCPCCVGLPAYTLGADTSAKWHGGRLAILFSNPVDGGPPHPVDFHDRYDLAELTELHDHHFGGVHWQRTGETFDALSLSPSINCDSWKHWHGFVRDGAIV